MIVVSETIFLVLFIPFLECTSYYCVYLLQVYYLLVRLNTNIVMFF